MTRLAWATCGTSGTTWATTRRTVSVVARFASSAATRPSSSARTGPARPVAFTCTRPWGRSFTSPPPALHLWFYAMYLMTSTRSGISAKQLERELGVTYKTAWRIFPPIRTNSWPRTTSRSSFRASWKWTRHTWAGPSPLAAGRSFAPKTPKRRSAAQKWSDKKKVQVFGLPSSVAVALPPYVIPSRQKKPSWVTCTPPRVPQRHRVHRLGSRSTVRRFRLRLPP